MAATSKAPALSGTDAKYADAVDIAYCIENFSSYRTDVRLYTPTESCGGYKWRLLIFPNGNRVEKVVSVYLDFVGPDTEPHCDCESPAAGSSSAASSAQASDAPLAGSQRCIARADGQDDNGNGGGIGTPRAQENKLATSPLASLMPTLPLSPLTPTLAPIAPESPEERTLAPVAPLEDSLIAAPLAHMAPDNAELPEVDPLLVSPPSPPVGVETQEPVGPPTSTAMPAMKRKLNRTPSTVEARVFFSVIPPAPTAASDDPPGVISTAHDPAWSPSSSTNGGCGSRGEPSRSNAATEPQPIPLKECSHRFTEPDNDWGFRELMVTPDAKMHVDQNGGLTLRARVVVYRKMYTEVRDKVIQASAGQQCCWSQIVPLVQRYEDLAANAPTRIGLGEHSDGASLLHAACKFGSLSYAGLLLARGAQIDVQDDSARTPLFYAVASGHLDVVKWLIYERNVNVNVRDSDSRTPLFYACENGLQNGIVETLIARGADIHVCDRGGETPARVAEDNGHEELAAMLRSMQTAP